MLSLTPTEKKAVVVLVLVIGCTGIVRLIQPMTIRSELYDYSMADSIFQRTSAASLQRADSSAVLDSRQEDKHGIPAVTSFINQKEKQPPAPGSVDINRASVGELELLPHIGPAMAKRIAAFRKSNGRFKSLQELKKVKGIGDKTFASIKPYLQEIK
jgi:comEA protein